MAAIDVINYEEDRGGVVFDICYTIYLVQLDTNNAEYWLQNHHCGCPLCIQLSQGHWSPKLIRIGGTIHDLSHVESDVEEQCTDCDECETIRNILHMMSHPHCDCEFCSQTREEGVASDAGTLDSQRTEPILWLGGRDVSFDD